MSADLYPTLYRRSIHREHRGDIFRIWEAGQFGVEFVEDKVSISHKGVVRGFHGDDCTHKMITCLFGRVQLIAYSLKTKTRYEWELDDNTYDSVLLPPYFLNAHQCLSHSCVFHYKISDPYDLKNQWSVRYNDKELVPNGWKLEPTIVSDRDRNSPSLTDFLKATFIK
jgi:dTDP-4-dehydrorhamnose 3,5-epimerase